jgi:regulation of enolase protein 1 (concanavalin A-like superfamily)
MTAMKCISTPLVRTLAACAFLFGLTLLLPGVVSAQSLPPGWAAVNVGNPAVLGTVSFGSSRFTVRGAGADIWGTADEFMFVHWRLTGDGDIVARVDSMQNANPYAKAGVMIRESLTAGSTHALAATYVSHGAAFQRRRVTGGVTTYTTGGAASAPVWLKLERRGSTLRAYRSADGVTWTTIGSEVISMASTVYVGLAVNSRNVYSTTEAVFSNVRVTPVSPAPGTLPSGWSSLDIGGPAAVGSSTYNAGTYSVKGAGSDIGTDYDQFQYAYRQMSGDINLVARVASVENVNVWTKAGVMIRDTLTVNAAHASMFVTPGMGVAFQRRPIAGGLSQSTTTSSARAPHWVKLQRRGSVITAFQSSDGVAWAQVGTMTLSLPTVYVGLAVASRITSVTATALFDNVTASAPGGNQPPSVSLTAPASNATFPAPASVTIAATASDADGSVARVDFYNGTSLIGFDTTSPYSYTWGGVPAGTYTLRAMATDNNGSTATSAARTISVLTPTNQAPSVALTAPADGDTVTAPATMTVAATASDADGTIAGVDFFAGTTLVGTDSSLPYSLTWSNVPAGTYSMTAVARDNNGAVTTSAARTVVVTNPLPALPSGWTSGDIGLPAVTGSAGHGAGTFALEGAGTDIGNASDQFRYAYRQFTGDIEIVSRVVSLENTHEWAKAGVMIRATLAADAAKALLALTPGHGTNFFWRPTAGALTQLGPTIPGGAPTWVKLERRGTVVTASQSTDGVTWTSAGTMTMPGATMYVGLAVTSHDVARAATGVFDSVVVRTPTPTNQPPSVSLTAPAAGATFSAPATVTVAATSTDADGSIASVSFFAGTTLIGSDTTSPYSVTWTSVAAGTYSLTSVARDDSGATTTSAARSITVGLAPPVVHRAVFVASLDHATGVDRYVLNIYPSGANPAAATPVATRDLGKPTVVSGECNVDVSATVHSLAAGTYIATVSAVGSSGSATSAPSASFTR